MGPLLTMKLTAVVLSHKPPVGKPKQLCIEYDVSDISFWQRGTVKEFVSFFAGVLVERVPVATRQSVVTDDGQYVCHVYVRRDGLGCVVVADNEYPARVAFGLIHAVIDEFSVKHPIESWHKPPLALPSLTKTLATYQDPSKADNLVRVQNELDAVMQTLNTTIGSLLERGEDLGDLVERSNTLSTQSKAFYKTAKSQNSCCEIM